VATSTPSSSRRSVATWRCSAPSRKDRRARFPRHRRLHRRPRRHRPLRPNRRRSR